MPKPFMARDSPHYGNTTDYYYPPVAGAAVPPFMTGPGLMTMPTTMMINQFGPATTPPPPPHQGYYHPHHPHPHHHPPPPPQQHHPHHLPQQSLGNNLHAHHHQAMTTLTPPMPPPPAPHPQPTSSSSTLPLMPVTTATTPSTTTTGTTTPTASLDQEYCDFLYHVGFLQGKLADTYLTIPALQKTYSVHALVVARSPTLHRLLVSATSDTTATTVKKTGNKYHVELTDMPGSVTEEAVQATLGHLYRPMAHPDIMYLFARPRVLLSILDVADYLEIQPLTTTIYDALSHEWNLETILFWLPYLSTTTTGAAFEYGVHYLTQTLPQHLDAFYNDNYLDLAHVYAHLPPHGLLERCIEADALPVRDPMQRLDFAKQVMALRKQWMDGDDGISVALRFHQHEVAVRVIHPSS